ncbi:decarboxylase iboD-like [Nymphaea colorata]|uniref:decarboxylase iboD-like n=1 Tax=Nymphaea colorata TaxID=210225 RepID=UPI00129DDEF3|nr:decarboxylase iboD-like [Nymphaea colorata]
MTLGGKSGDDVLRLINSACQSPPCFSLHPLVGFPINAIFVEFMQTQNGRAFFADREVNAALKPVLDDYNRMLQSPASLAFMNADSPSGWLCPEALAQVDMAEYECSPEEPHYGFRCWNEWFLRKFRPGARAVGAGSPEGVPRENTIVSSCESTPLLSPLQPQTNGGPASLFEGGTVYQAFLSALFYHRWHSPVDGVVEDVYDIAGTYYLDQSEALPYDEASPDMSQSFLSAVATRKVVVIRAANARVGRVAIIYIGMAEVSSCVTTVRVGDSVKQGTRSATLSSEAPPTQSSSKGRPN